MIAVAGIDVGKANLDVSISRGQVVRFDNTTAGIAKLIKHLNDHDDALAVREPTGGYEAKTDPLDARVLARYGEVVPEAETWEPGTDPHR